MHLPRSLEDAARLVVGAFYFACGIVFLAILGKSLESISLPDLFDIRERWFADKVLTSVLLNTIQLAILSLVLQLGLAFIGTLLVHQVSGLTKVLLIVPYAAGVITSAFPIYIFFSSALGPFETNILGSEIGARLVIVALDTWQWSGILLLACFVQFEIAAESGSRGFEQARLEGIGRVRAWWLIRWPAIREVVLLYVCVRCLDWFRKADVVHLMYSEGGPGYKIQTFGSYLEQIYFSPSVYQRYAILLILAQMIVGAYLLSLLVRFAAARSPIDED